MSGAGTPELRAQLKAIVFVVWGATGIRLSPRRQRPSPEQMNDGESATKKHWPDIPVPQISQGGSLARAVKSPRPEHRQLTLDAY